MSVDRRAFLDLAAGAGVAAALSHPATAAASTMPAVIKPLRLRPGDVVGLVGPANATFLRSELTLALEAVEALGLKPKPGAHLLDRYGYFAGRDRDRASDINGFFADPEVKGILAIRGGWGSARVLPHLDYDLIRRNPKVFLGYSDITALLLAIHARTGLVTAHGPVGDSEWNAFSVEWLKRVLFEGEAVRMENPRVDADDLVVREARTWTITPGTARGRLLGGNLTVLSHLVGTPYLPEWDGAILFLEDIHEDIYRMDRMLTHLGQAGILGKARGFVFGTCTECEPGEGYGALTLEEVFDDHVKALGIPAFSGAMIGHQRKRFTVPLGIQAEIDAGRGTVQLLEPAVA